MAKQIGFGVIGCGGIARNAHLPAIKQIDEAQIIAVSNPRIAKAESAAADFGAKAVYSDHMDVINHPEVDAVIICSPPKFHMEQTIAAAKAGKHILCEKPMARDIAEAKEMIKLAQQHNVKLVIAEPKRYNPSFRKIKALLDDDVIGESFMVRYHNSYCELHTRSSWWVVPDISGGGEMMNELTHQANTLRWYFGEVTEVSCISNHPLGPPPEDNACVNLRFANGVIATVTVSWMTRHYNLTFPAPLDHAWDERIEIFGKEGSIIIETPIGYWDVPAQLRVYTEKELPGFNQGWNYIKVASADVYVEQLKHFIDCVVKDEPSEVPGEEGLADLAVVRAAYQSEEKRSVVGL